MVNEDTDLERRNFLKLAAAGGIGGMATLAGCSSIGGDGSSGGGDKLPQYTYLNNPPNYNPARNEAISIIGEELNRLGLDVNVQVFEWGTLYTKITEEHDFSFATWSRGLGIDPGRRMVEQFHSDNVGPGQGNFTGYENGDLDPKLRKQLQLDDGDERISLLHDIQSTVNEDVPMHPIVQMPNIVAYNSEQVSGWTDHLAGYYHMEPQTNIEVDNPDKELRGAWAETLGTMNVLGYNNETKLIHQFEMLYDKLVRINSDLEADPELSLATEWERPDDKSVRYKIREGHTWHDGEDVTPEDVKFTLDYISDNEIALFATQWEMYDSSEVDGQWVTVNFSDTVGPVHKLFSNQLPILPQHVWEGRNDPSNASVNEPIGSGPLQFDYWDQGNELSLTKFDDHFKPVKYEKRIWSIIPEDSTVWSLLKQGNLNYLPYTRIGKQLSDNQKAGNIGVKSMPGDGWWHFSQNTRKEGLDDKAVRQAAVHAIPKKAINEQVMYGFATEGWNLIGESFGKFSNPDVKKYQEEEGVGVGQQLLEEAGYVIGDDGKVRRPADSEE